MGVSLRYKVITEEGSINISDPIKLSQGLIRFNTINPPGNEDELGNYLTALLESAGFECMDVDFAPRRRSIGGRIAGVARNGVSDQ